MVSVCLAEKADGTKLKPLIVFRGTKRESKALDEEFKVRYVVYVVWKCLGARRTYCNIGKESPNFLENS